jgi:hypothetical protein
VRLATFPGISRDISVEQAHILKLALNEIPGSWFEPLLARLLPDAPLRHEVPRDIEDDLGALTVSWRGIGNPEPSSGTESHRDRIGPVIPHGDVES